MARGDVGLDFIVDGEDPGSAFLHADLGAGVQNQRGAALVELSTLAFLEDGDELLHVVAITGELYTGKTTPYVTLSVPFQTGEDPDDEGSFFREDITNIGIGLRGQI